MISYSINAEENLLYCNISEEIKLPDVKDYIFQLVEDEKFRPKLNTIIKINENVRISYGREAAGIGQFFTQFLQKSKGVAWAFVTSNQTTKGMARLVIDEIDSSPITIDYFNTEDEAKKWITGLASE